MCVGRPVEKLLEWFRHEIRVKLHLISDSGAREK